MMTMQIPPTIPPAITGGFDLCEDEDVDVVRATKSGLKKESEEDWKLIEEDSALDSDC
jgi:hypothetical protein